MTARIHPGSLEAYRSFIFDANSREVLFDLEGDPPYDLRLRRQQQANREALLREPRVN